MKIPIMFENKNKSIVSFEIFPPKEQFNYNNIENILNGLCESKPDFISVTCGTSGMENFQKTVDICTLLKEKYNIEPLCHFTCYNLSKTDVFNALELLRHRNIENILALRGDNCGFHKNHYSFAKDLIADIKGKDFAIGATCYPEGHIDTENMEDEIKYAKEKMEKGANFLISQLCFSWEIILNHFENLQKNGVSIPLCAGIMPILSKSQVEKMIYKCGVSLPKDIIKILNKYGDNSLDLQKAGIEYSVKEIRALKKRGANNFHIYTMNKPDVGNALYNEAFN